MDNYSINRDSDYIRALTRKQSDNWHSIFEGEHYTPSDWSLLKHELGPFAVHGVVAPASHVWIGKDASE